VLLKALRLVELIAHFAIQNFCKALIVVIGIVVTYLANWLMCVCLLHQTAIAGAHNELSPNLGDGGDQAAVA